MWMTIYMSSDRTKQICLWITIYIFIYIYIWKYVLRVIVIVMGNEISILSSNPEQGCLCFNSP